jgi:hypothetical protein
MLIKRKPILISVSLAFLLLSGLSVNLYSSEPEIVTGKSKLAAKSEELLEISKGFDHVTDMPDELKLEYLSHISEASRIIPFLVLDNRIDTPVMKENLYRIIDASSADLFASINDLPRL